MAFWVPKGANRFHFVDGSRFVHGGAMPQEVAVPVIRVHHVKEGGKAAKTKTRTVGVSVLGSNFKVTTNRHRFQLIQTEPVGDRVKWPLLARLVPFVQNNYNCCELGPRGTGKSHIYKEISPNSILISGGQTTVANLFYNIARRTVGLVGLLDLVAFDEVAGISFKDKDGVQIMKDFMACGSFARGKDAVQASASMVFVGNINQPVDTLVKTSHLLAPFPETRIDSAFFDRFQAYIPGWEVPKMGPEFFALRKSS